MSRPRGDDPTPEAVDRSPPDRGIPLVAVGWKVDLADVSEANPQYVLAVSVWFVDPGKEPTGMYTKVFVGGLGPCEAEGDRMNPRLSGVLGLLSPWGRIDDEGYHRTVERSVSDLLTWAMWDARKAAEDRRGAVLLQGPLLPKLRGRIYYQMMDFGNVPLYVLTQDPLWLARLLKEFEPCDIDGVRDPWSNTEGQRDAWAGPLPDLALDSPERSYKCSLADGILHVVVPANSIPATQSHKFFSLQHREHVSPGWDPRETHKGEGLPKVLSLAVKKAESDCDTAAKRLNLCDRFLKASGAWTTTEATKNAGKSAKLFTWFSQATVSRGLRKEAAQGDFEAKKDLLARVIQANGPKAVMDEIEVWLQK